MFVYEDPSVIAAVPLERLEVKIEGIVLNFYKAPTNRQDGPSVFLEKDVKIHLLKFNFSR